MSEFTGDYENENEESAPSPDPETEADDEPVFETTPEAATDLKSGGDLKPKFFKRKNILIMICASLSAVVLICLLLNAGKNSKKSASSAEDEYTQAAASSREFINTLQNQAVRNSQREARNQQEQGGQNPPVINEEAEEEIEALLPPVVIERQRPEPPPAPAQPQYQPPPPQQQQGGGSGGGSQQQQQPTHLRSPLVPQVQGSLFSAQNPPPQNNANAASSQPGLPAGPYDFYPSLPPNQTPAANQQGYAGQGYTAQNNQADKQNFYSSSSNAGAIFGGVYLGENCVWPGTVISGVLETAINTDLPGHVIARVTNNVYDSQTGRQLLIPQGSVLIARYNSSISYAQSRIQIVWDTLIRPDGYQISLGSAPGVDTEGMAGQAAKYSENWFEYVKAAGIITMFSIANAEITKTVAEYSSNPDTAANVAADNAQVINQLGSNIINRALDIQPTLTVKNGTLISIMLNNSLYLPPLKPAPAVQKFQLGG